MVNSFRRGECKLSLWRYHGSKFFDNLITSVSVRISFVRSLHNQQNNISNMEVADGEALAPAMMVMGAWLEEGWPFKADLSVAYGAQSGTFSWRGLHVVPFPRLFSCIKRFEPTRIARTSRAKFRWKTTRPMVVERLSLTLFLNFHLRHRRSIVFLTFDLK